jgi:hypothetical protein
MNKIIYAIIGLVLVAGSFFGGYYYEKKACANTNPNMGFDGSKLGGTPPTGAPDGSSSSSFNGRGNGGPGGGGSTGEIISNDGKSITIKTSDGSTKIVYFSDSTKVSKNETASTSDLTVGTTVSAMGTTNSDKSVTAQNIMIGTFSNK